MACVPIAIDTRWHCPARPHQCGCLGQGCCTSGHDGAVWSTIQKEKGEYKAQLQLWVKPPIPVHSCALGGCGGTQKSGTHKSHPCKTKQTDKQGKSFALGFGFNLECNFFGRIKVIICKLLLRCPTLLWQPSGQSFAMSPEKPGLHRTKIISPFLIAKLIAHYNFSFLRDAGNSAGLKQKRLLMRWMEKQLIYLHFTTSFSKCLMQLITLKWI